MFETPERPAIWSVWVVLLTLAALFVASDGPRLDADSALALAAGAGSVDSSGVDRSRPIVGSTFATAAGFAHDTVGLRTIWLARWLAVVIGAALVLFGTRTADRRGVRPDQLTAAAFALVIWLVASSDRLDRLAVDAPGLLLALAAVRRRPIALPLVILPWLLLQPTAWPLALFVLAPPLAATLLQIRQRAIQQREGPPLEPFALLLAAGGVATASFAVRRGDAALWLDAKGSLGTPGALLGALILLVALLRFADRTLGRREAWWLAGALLLIPLSPLALVFGLPLIADFPRLFAANARGRRRWLGSALLSGVGLGIAAQILSLAPRFAAFDPASPQPTPSGVEALLLRSSPPLEGSSQESRRRILEPHALTGRLAASLQTSYRLTAAGLGSTPAGPAGAIAALDAALREPGALRQRLAVDRPHDVVLLRTRSLNSAAIGAILRRAGYALIAFDDDLVLWSRQGAHSGDSLERFDPFDLASTLDAASRTQADLEAARRDVRRLAQRAPSPLATRLAGELALLSDDPQAAVDLGHRAAVESRTAHRQVPLETTILQSRSLRASGDPRGAVETLRARARRLVAHRVAERLRGDPIDPAEELSRHLFLLQRIEAEAEAGDPARALALHEEAFGRFPRVVPRQTLDQAASLAEAAQDPLKAPRLRRWADWVRDAALAAAETESLESTEPASEAGPARATGPATPSQPTSLEGQPE